MGRGVGQLSDPHFDPHQKIKIRNKKPSKTEVFEGFWSCYPDLNWGPHPYQLIGCRQCAAIGHFPAIFAQKDEVFGPLVSVVPTRSFSRVGHGVGQGMKNTEKELCSSDRKHPFFFLGVLGHFVAVLL